jgi:hypothetical protein
VAEYISVSEAGRRRGASTSAVTRWIVAGTPLRDGTRLKLKAIRLPGGFRTTQAWLDEFIDILTRDWTGAAMPPEVGEESARRPNAELAANGR